MLTIIIPSRNRPAQLDLLLRSINRNLLGNIEVNIIAKYDKEYHDSLDILMQYHFDDNYNSMNLYSERNFREDFLGLVKQAQEYIAISCDDNVIHRKFTLPNFEEVFTSDVCVFSMRYGLNTTLQDCYNNLYQSPLRSWTDLENNLIKWSFLQYHPHMNYGYPFGLDMHVYRRSDLLRWCEKINFSNTNQLETGLFHLRNEVPPMIVSPKQSVSVNIPYNNLSGVTQSDNLSVEDMNHLFGEGKRIDLDHIMAQDIIGSHQQIELKWM